MDRLRRLFASTPISLLFGLLLSCSALNRADAQVVTTDYTGPFHPADAPAGIMSQGVFNSFTNFTVSNGTTSARWDLNLTPIAFGNQPVYLADPAVSGTQVNYETTLAAAFPKYTFNYINDPTDELGPNSLIVKTYSTFLDGPNPNPGIGADFAVQYNPNGGPDNPPASQTHWIQVISTNWELNSAPPTNDNKVDNLGAADPFYDTNGAATSTSFFDRPERDPTDPVDALWNGTAGYQGPVTWTAEDYLVQDLGPNGDGGEDVTVWDGVRYGFVATLATPEPGSLAYAGLFVFSGAGFVTLRRRNSFRRRRA